MALEYGSSAPSITVPHCMLALHPVHSTHYTVYKYQTVFHLDQKVDSATALRHRIAIIPIHPATLFSALLRPNYKPQTKKGDPRKSLNWILGPIWWLRSAASRFKYTSYNLCQERSQWDRTKWRWYFLGLTWSCRRSSRIVGSPSATSVTSCPCSSRLDGRLPTAALLLGRNNGRRAAIGWAAGAGQPGGQCWELPQATLAPAIPHLHLKQNLSRPKKRTSYRAHYVD